MPEKGRTFAEVKATNVRELPIVLPNEEVISDSTDIVEDIFDSDKYTRKLAEDTPNEHGKHPSLIDLAKKISTLKQSTFQLNLSLLDHLGNYDPDGPLLTEVGFAQPPGGVADSILQETAATRANLRVGSVAVERETPSTVTIHLSARYKPEDEEEYATDRWGYTETDPLPALRITDLPETEADLIRAFVPVAVEEAGGFGGFRETATKTNSLIDRLEALTLPVLSEVERGLERYIDTRERAAELDERIERTDELIDEIVYELYGLTDEEIEIVENAVGD